MMSVRARMKPAGIKIYWHVFINAAPAVYVTTLPVGLRGGRSVPAMCGFTDVTTPTSA